MCLAIIQTGSPWLRRIQTSALSTAVKTGLLDILHLQRLGAIRLVSPQVVH
jgi:hypothetical protein